MLLKEHHDRDPVVQQSIHEHVSFIKLQEGYPLFFHHTNDSKHNTVEPVPGANPINILDIYESLSLVTRVAAVITNMCAELNEVHRPDSGFITAALELKAMEFLLVEMRGVAQELEGDRIGSGRDIDLI